MLRPERGVPVAVIISDIRFANGRRITVSAIRHQDGGPSLCEVATASAGKPAFKIWLPRRAIEEVIAGLEGFLQGDWRQQ